MALLKRRLRRYISWTVYVLVSTVTMRNKQLARKHVVAVRMISSCDLGVLSNVPTRIELREFPFAPADFHQYPQSVAACVIFIQPLSIV